MGTDILKVKLYTSTNIKGRVVQRTNIKGKEVKNLLYGFVST